MNDSNDPVSHQKILFHTSWCSIARALLTLQNTTASQPSSLHGNAWSAQKGASGLWEKTTKNNLNIGIWSNYNISPTYSRFPLNKVIFLTKPPFGGNRSCEVAIIWPEEWSSICGTNRLDLNVFFGTLQENREPQTSLPLPEEHCSWNPWIFWDLPQIFLVEIFVGRKVGMEFLPGTFQFGWLTWFRLTGVNSPSLYRV